MSLFVNYNNLKEKGDYPYSNRHMSRAKVPFSRFCGRHKRSGATYLPSLKQFDTSRVKVFAHFDGKTANPRSYRQRNIVWWFGKGGCKKLAFNTKFRY